MRAMFDHYSRQLGAIKGQDAKSVAHGVHSAVDDLLKRERENRSSSSEIKCRKGCAHCCHGPVEIWPHEAALLLAAAREAGIAVDEARLVRQNSYDMDTWREQPLTDRACVFLAADGACGVYEARPTACRKLLVVTDPALCDADKHAWDSVGRWICWEAEMLESAALDAFGGELMPARLLAEMNRT